MTEAYAILRDAILKKMQVVFDLDGYRREACPHVIGVNNDGEEQVLVYQFGGGSSSGLPPGGRWRCCPVSRIVNIKVQVGKWYAGQGHSRPQACVARVDVEVEY